MKKTISTIIFSGTVASILFLASCKKQEIGVYNSGRYLQFVTPFQDSISFSFFYHLGKNEVTIGMPVKLIGQLFSEDQQYTVEALLSEGTATAANYSLPAAQVFRKGVTRDTAWITVKNTPGLETSNLRLVLHLKGGSQIEPGQTEATYKIIRLTASVSKPTWWDSNMDLYYLGRYSEKKFRKFMEVTGVGDLEPLNNNQRLIYFLQFKYYLINQKQNGTPVYMEDGADMLSTVPLLG
ncbi:DUF4843 domain-containing protein [Pseudobacter ginsenosidimutans]|uniref:Uncharacterized protein DUF4843 n=1 Tax=Pseudobacter ginsenosidimutans TaxID=661488 RepID=A0A4Q7N5S3_9BACT|nr:DUF4843 domain-containing protein [Pseudobacter ginsenosidimutans]QEC44922.1 DUF4843 domain-containing protein [Pseudobacter ginsenosidimutans]RZS76413.1 uncharacterized protein DUF4843 [Pseudobacter ginsenosidimutans]